MTAPRDVVVAVTAGLGGMLGWGFADFFAKKTIDAIGDVVTLVWAHVFGTATLLGLALYAFVNHQHSGTSSYDMRTWVLLALLGALQAVVYLLVYRGFGKGQVSILNPVFASFSGLTALFSIVVFGEVVAGNLLAALAVIFAGILLINIDVPALRARRVQFVHVPGLKEVAAGTGLAAAWTLSWDKAVRGHDWLVYAALMYAFMTVVLLGVARFRRVKLSVPAPGAWKFLVAIGICETGAYLAISLGYATTSRTSIVALLSGAFSLPTIVLARLFLKEKVTGPQAIGGLTIVAGIMLLSLG